VFGGLDPVKILIVLVVAVMILGPERLPKAARQLGAGWRELTKLRDKLESEVRSAMPDMDIPKIPALTPRGITGFVGGMRVNSANNSAKNAAATEGDEAEEAEEPAEILGSSRRPGSRPATNRARAGASLPSSEWRSSAPEAVAEHSELPAGWQAIGAPGPGYASGSTLAPVPSYAASSQLGIEASVSFDEPSWN